MPRGSATNRLMSSGSPSNSTKLIRPARCSSTSLGWPATMNSPIGSDGELSASGACPGHSAATRIAERRSVIRAAVGNAS